MSKSLSNRSASFIRMGLSDCADVPPAGETWTTSETDLDAGDINRLASKDIIQAVGQDGSERVWETDPVAWDRIQTHIDELGVLPCGHRPFSTVDLDSARPYSCLGDDCDARYTREQIEAVVDGE
jgi:hypothetical protein